VTRVEPHATVFGYLLATASFSSLGAGAIGGRYRSRQWVIYLAAALTLASVLVGGTAVYYGFVNPTTSEIKDPIRPKAGAGGLDAD
jgi:hypothetical protein